MNYIKNLILDLFLNRKKLNELSINAKKSYSNFSRDLFLKRINKIISEI
jgi:hypothetical protein